MRLILALGIVLSAHFAFAQPPADSVKILSIAPATPARPDLSATFTVSVEVSLASASEATVVLGFNSERAMNFEMGNETNVKAGIHRLALSGQTTPSDWGRLTGFHALVILKPSETTGMFRPLATDQFTIAVTAKPASTIHADMFPSLSVDGKLDALADITAARSDLTVEEVIQLVQDALRDSNASVRLGAVRAVSARTKAADSLSPSPIVRGVRSTEGQSSSAG